MLIDTNGLFLQTFKASESVTLNEDIGMKFSMPLPQIHNVSSTAVLGLDYKHYEVRDVQDSIVGRIATETNGSTVITYGNFFQTAKLPVNNNIVDYFPLSLVYSGSAPDKWGSTAFNAQANYNVGTIGSLRGKFLEYRGTPVMPTTWALPASA